MAIMPATAWLSPEAVRYRAAQGEQVKLEERSWKPSRMFCLERGTVNSTGVIVSSIHFFPCHWLSLRSLALKVGAPTPPPTHFFPTPFAFSPGAFVHCHAALKGQPPSPFLPFFSSSHALQNHILYSYSVRPADPPIFLCTYSDVEESWISFCLGAVEDQQDIFSAST